MSSRSTPATRAAASDESLHEAVAERLDANGQRYTGGRRQIVDVLSAAERPLSMYDILDHVGDMPQSSAYRHLTVLATSGVVHRLSGNEDFGFFELTDELSGHHHHHVMCAVCGSVADVPASPRLEKALAEAAELAAAQSGFDLSGHRIDLVGTCQDCSRK